MRSCGVEGQALTVAPSLSEGCEISEKLAVQKSYNRSAIVGILGNVAYCGINNIRAFSTLSGFDPDQVHQIFLETSSPYSPNEIPKLNRRGLR